MTEGPELPYSNADKLAEAKRELVMRQRVYPGMVKSGTLSLADARKRIAIMAAIVHDYAYKVDGETPSLFPMPPPH